MKTDRPGNNAGVTLQSLPRNRVSGVHFRGGPKDTGVTAWLLHVCGTGISLYSIGAAEILKSLFLPNVFRSLFRSFIFFFLSFLLFLPG